MDRLDLNDVLARCIERGVRLAAADGKLRVHYEGAAPDETLLALLRDHREALLRHLAAAPPVASGASVPVLSAAARARVAASPAQRRIWLVGKLDGSSAQYNMVGAYRIEGTLDVAALDAALDATVARHEALRTRFDERDGELWQVVEPPVAVRCERIEAAHLADDAYERAWRELLARENAYEFDLSRGPLIRATVMQRSAQAWVLVLNVHHIVCDGWSVGLLLREIGECYAACRGGRDPQLAAPKLQYADCAAWQGAQADAPEMREALAHWTATLAGAPPLHGLPLDKPRPPVRTSNGGKVYRSLERDALAELRSQCRSHGVTTFMFLQAAFAGVLHVHAHERDLVIGTPVAGRAHAEFAHTVGLFVNTLALRSVIDGDPTFVEMLAAAKRTLLAALDRQHVAYDTLVDALKPERSRAYTPLVQVLFALQARDEQQLLLEGLSIEALDNPGEPVKFDLQLVVEEAQDRLRFVWHYNRDLFDEISIARLANSYARLLDAVVEDPRRRLFELPLADERTSTRDGRAVDREFPRLDTLFEQHARTSPQRPAVSCGAETLSYAELDMRANALAALLVERGASRGSRVALCTGRSIETIVGMLGVLKAGAAYVPLDPAHPRARLAAIIADCGAEVLLTEDARCDELGGMATHVVGLGAATSVEPPYVAGRSTADPAYAIYTSGTTGTPKGVLVAHAGVVNLLEHFDALAPVAAPNGSLWCSTSFDVSVYEIFSVMCRGGTLHIVPETLRLAPEALFAWLEDRRIASAFMHAGYLEQFGQYLAQTSREMALKRLLVGVEPISIDHLQAIATRIPGVAILNGYGPTEATVCCTVFTFDPARYSGNGRVPIGRAVSGMTLHIANAGGGTAPDGAIGELHVGGVGLALGYLGRPELTASRFIVRDIAGKPERLYRTGDLVRRLPSGDLEFVARVDEQIKIRGFRVEPGEIEVRLCELAAISDALVVAVGEGADKRLVAYVALTPAAAGGAGGDFAAGVRRELRRVLPDYMVPADVVVLDAIPLTANGKPNRAALPVPSAAPVRRVAPRNDIERRMAKLWSDVLGVGDVGITDDFFALGGQSLLAARLIGRVQREFALVDDALSLGELFENPTIEALAEAVESAQRAAALRNKERRLAALDDVEEGVF